MSDDDKDNVIEVSFPSQESPAIEATYTYDRPRCRHVNIVLDMEGRKVRCRGCRKEMDPFDVLADYAGKERHFRYWQKETNELAERVEALKLEEQRIKARTRNAARRGAMQSSRSLRKRSATRSSIAE